MNCGQSGLASDSTHRIYFFTKHFSHVQCNYCPLANINGLAVVENTFTSSVFIALAVLTEAASSKVKLPSRTSEPSPCRVTRLLRTKNSDIGPFKKSILHSDADVDQIDADVLYSDSLSGITWPGRWSRDQFVFGQDDNVFAFCVMCVVGDVIDLL